MTVLSKPWKLYNAAKKIFTGGTQKTTGTGAINTTNISKNLKEFQKHKDDIIKSTDKYTKSAKTEEDKIKFRKFTGPALGKLSKITQNKPVEKKAKGGRVGLKFGGGADMGKKKSNVQKIKETFGPKKQLSAKQMKIAKLAGNRKKIDAQDLAKLRGRA
jgi:hypothetical protein